MPEIAMNVVSMDAAPLPEPLSCRFDGDGGTIGRDSSSTLVLQDKHRRVSRLHAAVTFSAGAFTITNASTSLPISMGEILLDCGQTMQLSSGDAFEIGPYVLRVQSVVTDDLDALAPILPDATETGPVAAPPDVVTQLFPRTRVDASMRQPVPPPVPFAASPAMAGDDPFASLLEGIGPGLSSSSAAAEPGVGLGYVAAGPMSHPVSYPPSQPLSGQPVDDPLAGISSGAMNRSMPVPHEEPGVSKDPLAALGFDLNRGADPHQPAPVRAERPSEAIIPQDFNPFDLPSETGRNSADPLSSLWGGATQSTASLVAGGEPSIDSLFTPTGSSSFDGLLSGQTGGPSWPAGSSSQLVATENSDPLAMFGNAYPAADSRMRPMRDDLAEISGAFRPPRAVKPEIGSTPQNHPFPAAGEVRPASAPAPVYATDALTAAFLKGANLPLSALPQGLTPEVMTMVGSLLRSATAGAVDMLAARTATKLEVQASVTIISPEANNPLKFLPNGDVALQQLLRKKMPGFMRADEAMKDAFDDLRAHEIGVIAGTRAALAEVLGKFDPAVLGEQLGGGSLLDSFLPAVRKVKLWGIYLERYSQIRREAEDDFQSIFGRAFVKAYEDETARMKKQQSEAG